MGERRVARMVSVEERRALGEEPGMNLSGKRRARRLKAMAPLEPELDRRRIRVRAGQAPDPGQVAALVAQGYTYAHTARVGWGASDELDY
jgi:hypothetical protein